MKCECFTRRKLNLLIFFRWKADEFWRFFDDDIIIKGTKPMKLFNSLATVGGIQFPAGVNGAKNDIKRSGSICSRQLNSFEAENSNPDKTGDGTFAWTLYR